MNQKPYRWCCYKKMECSFGGNRTYNYGFLTGTASFCGKENKFCCDMKKCPLDVMEVGEQPTTAALRSPRRAHSKATS
jgi:hypothetical protein